ncbi:hypothetical protein SAY87_022508 [Trapa incisa]|uniref:Uncharacterized protein n=1 Tax=Trapa incisa TaxID=236973 RepID=A0AAN7Q4E8_9MYRT|nr:hypothetical protein SAY87_022508 [Trapa incisa]
MEEKNSNIVASAGLGGEVFIWDIEAAAVLVSKSSDPTEENGSNGIISIANRFPVGSFRTISSSSNISTQFNQSSGYTPTAAKGHKESVYALAMNGIGTLLVSGETEKVVRVWDPRSGSKSMKLEGHTDNIRALLLDSTGRFCLSGSSDSMIRLWDLGQQRCIHSYAVHTDSVRSLASTPTFGHVYSGGRDMSLYLTDLATRESLLLCTEEHPILQVALQDDSIWIATTDSSVHRWPAEGRHPQKALQRGGSFLAGNLSFSRARVSLEGSSLIPLYKEPELTIPGSPAIIQHEVLNNRRHVLTKDSVGSVKLWEITRGIVVEDYGKIPFDEKKEELFEMVNLARETLKGLLAHWLTKRRQRLSSQSSSANGDLSGKDFTARSLVHSRIEVDGSADNDSIVYLPFQFSTISPSSIITEGSQGGPWRKKITDLYGTEDEKDIPWWCIDCVLNNRLPPRENTNFYLHPSEGSTVQILTQGKLSAPRILKIQKVVSYVLEKLVLDKPLDNIGSEGTLRGALQHSAFIDGSTRAVLKEIPRFKPSIEILCNTQVLPLGMSLATVRAYIWKKPEDLVLNYRVIQSK